MHYSILYEVTTVLMKLINNVRNNVRTSISVTKGIWINK